MNAAVWFGAAIFYTALVAPIFFTTDTLQLVQGIARATVLSQNVMERYHDLHLWCAGIALLHLVAECVYLGKPLSRFVLYLLAGLLGLSLITGFLTQPYAKKKLLRQYSSAVDPVEREQAGKEFRSWNGVTQFANFIMLAGVMIYLWQITGLTGNAREAAKFRS